jgi:hypothetical protein
MRAIATPAPTRNGKRRLLESCAITAGLMALAYGGPALAQVNGAGTIVTGGAGSTITNNAGTNTTTVNLSANQSIINWVPTDTATTGGAIDFLSSGENLTFNGNGNYTVLNRFVNGAGGSLSRQIALNGTINSTNSAASGARGGNIWFYNAGGILIGATGVIDVGSLVLTTNDIITTGGLFGPSGEIRFRGASGSTAGITVNGSIDTGNDFNPGSSYVALVAPRIVQASNVRVDGSVAYVAAEQADIRINSGLFDINVLVGAEGGNAITHTGTTTGPAHQQGDTDQNRIYMVAIPKNDAVTMLIRGSIGYDDALSAQVDPDGAVRLSAGYNIVAGELATAPVNATAANITVNDTLFRSNTVARASGAFLGQPLAPLPPPFLPAAPPPHIGRVVVQGNGTFIGDASATFNVGPNQLVGATGNFTVQSGGVGGAPGNSSVNVNGGGLSVGGNLAITSTGALNATSGDSQGGVSRLNITGGGLALITGSALVTANGIAGTDTGGNGGDGRGGTADVIVSGTGSTLSANIVLATAVGQGGGLRNNPVSGLPIAGDVGGDGVGGTATVTVENGASLSATQGLGVFAQGQGQVGLSQSGNGQGGIARISVSGAGSSFVTPATIINASGTGGGNISNPTSGTFTTLDGGDGTGGQASIVINTSATSTANFGTTSLDVQGIGGGAAGDSSAGGTGRGGSASISGAGGGTAQFSDVTMEASGVGGGDTDGVDSLLSGDGIGGNVNISATGGATLAINNSLNLSATGDAATSDSVGSGEGGNVTVSATAGGNINVGDQLNINVFGGSTGVAVIADSAGSGTGGDVVINADGGTIRADGYQVNASAAVVNSRGAGGPAQGGTISVTASNAGRILTTNDGSQFFDASAVSGASASGSNATGGAIQFIANAGTINMGLSATFAAGGTSGGAIEAGSVVPVGAGGSILIRTVADSADSSAISLGDFSASADGRTRVDVEGGAGVPNQTSGSGRGGNVNIEVQGGTFSTFSFNATANGYGGNGASDSSLGTGGTATFTQTGGTANVGDMTISANGFGGVVQGQSGLGIGGTATINLLGGTINAADIMATANGEGGEGSFGTDEDSGNILPGGIGGNGTGGNATINIEGSAVVNASTIVANAAGTGGTGGDFFNQFSFSGVPGTPGNGGDGVGGTAVVNVRGGTTSATSMIADASGIGGDGGNSFFSSSSGGATGFGVGGTGGAGRGGTATIALETSIAGVTNASAIARGFGGNGGSHNVGGNGGGGFGGLAQAIVANFEAGELAVTLDSSGRGGDGAEGNDGAGGNGGNGTGGTVRMLADGPDASLTVVETNFIAGGNGGNGGAGRLSFGSSQLVAPNGGNGGNGTGGTIEIAASEGGTVSLALAAGDSIVFRSIGRGGNGGNGANSVFSSTARAGDGGSGGGGTGGTVRLVTTGGTITSAGDDVDIDVRGASGTAGTGGVGQGGGANGANGGFSGTRGGLVAIEALNGESGPGQISLGQTNIVANGDIAGRIELRSEGSLSFASLDAEALGFAPPTNNDTDTAPAGIFAALNGGTISSQGEVTLTTGSSVGVYAQSNGIFDVDGNVTINAGDQIDIRHDFREGAAPTIAATGDLTASAGSINGAPGSLLQAGGTLSLTSTLGGIGVDRLDGNDIVMTAAGAASVEHAEATNDFTASGASFRTGLNSIITGGNIVVTSPGAVDLGNSTAGGFVQVDGQSITFNNIDAAAFVALTATGTTLGADGITGGSISAGSNISLDATRIAIGGTIVGGSSLFAFGSAGPVAINLATIAGDISVFAAGDLTGTYNAVGSIRLNSGANINASANATGFESSSSGLPIAASVFADAAGNVTLANSSSAGMFGVNAGGSASLNGANVGEDLLVRAGTTASLANVTAGDDIEVRAIGNIAATNVRATGAGTDTRILDYVVGNGFTISQGEGSSATNGSDIVLSAGGSIDAAQLSAGDDIIATAPGAIALNGATTLGLGVTGGTSDIRTQGGNTTLAGLDAFTDVIVASTGTVDVTGPVEAGRNIAVNANAVTMATLTAPGGDAINNLSADGNVVVASATNITGGRIRALGDITLTAGTAIDVDGIFGNNVAVDGATGITADQVFAVGTTTLNSNNGAITLGTLVSAGEVDARADSIFINGGSMVFANIITDVGDAVVRAGDLFVTNGNIAGRAEFSSSGERLGIDTLTARSAQLEASGGFMTLNNVTATGGLSASARTSLGISGVVTGQSIALASANIDIASTGRVGTAGATGEVSIINNNSDNQTFVGGTGTRNGYHIDAAELARVFGTDIEIFAPEVAAAGGGSVGSAAPPDVIVDSFTVTGGASNSNLGASGLLTIRTPGKMRVIGNVQLTGLSDTNTLNLFADEALEVILGQGTVRLLGANNAPGGQLNLQSDDIIVATAAAITDVGLATTTNAIEARLAQNDGVILDEGSLFARSIRADVQGGFYVQNSGTGTEFANRRGLTFGAGGLDVLTEGPSRIVVNGVQLGANGQITGLDTIPLLTVGGGVPATGSFDPRSTLNGCIIANPGACVVVTFENGFPVQDVIEEEADAESDDGNGNSLPVAPLITMRDLDPLSGEPLLDDPVTGAGNDDLWTPTEQP